MTCVLITGGMGYIGSHTITVLAKAGISVVVVDNFSTSKRSVIDRLNKIVGIEVPIYDVNILNTCEIERLLISYNVSSVIHFAALKSVGDSVSHPLDYYNNNVSGTISLLSAMKRANVNTLVFSSSATVYGEPNSVPITEEFPLSATNPYGRSKLMIENILSDLVASDPDYWRIARLRYFNPVGAHKSGLIGDDPASKPNNLMPYISQVALGIQPFLNIWGDDYPTIDGTGSRDYIHVMDLSEGHLAAINYLNKNKGLITVNLGTGTGTTVLEMVRAFEKASGKKITYKIGPRRNGDVAECWANPKLANDLLEWKALRSLEEMCEDSWRWQSKSQTIK